MSAGDNIRDDRWRPGFPSSGPRRERPRSQQGGGDTRTGAARRSTPDLDPGVINADRLRACSTATCPHCRRVVEFGALVVQGRRLDAP